MRLCLLLVFLGLAGCASDQIIIDQKGVDMSRYEQDYADCLGYAGQVDAGRQIVKGAGTGAAVGGLMGAVVGNSDTLAKGAGLGAVQGGTAGGLSADQEQRRVLVRCLRGRGYKVLN